MPRHRYEKCNTEANFGFRDLIHRVLSEAGRALPSADIYRIAVDKGYIKLLYANRPVPKTPWATLYARLSDEAKKEGGMVRRFERRDEYVYELVPGRTPGKGRKLDYTTRNVYVYALLDSLTQTPFYVGMGVGARKDCHLEGASHSRIVNEVVSHVRSLGREPVATLLKEGLTRSEARLYEAAYIKTYGRRSVDLTGVLFNQKS
jgi:hypothetical protein